MYSEKRKEQQRLWRLNNKERDIENKKNYYIKNKERLNKLNSDYFRTVKGKYAAYKTNAKNRNIYFDLTIEEFQTFWNKDCSYCGDGIETIGIDRIDSSIGYVLNNCRSCCAVCNSMKLDYTEEFWINHMKKVLDKIHINEAS